MAQTERDSCEACQCGNQCFDLHVDFGLTGCEVEQLPDNIAKNARSWFEKAVRSAGNRRNTSITTPAMGEAIYDLPQPATDILPDYDLDNIPYSIRLPEQTDSTVDVPAR